MRCMPYGVGENFITFYSFSAFPFLYNFSPNGLKDQSAIACRLEEHLGM